MKRELFLYKSLSFIYILGAILSFILSIIYNFNKEHVGLIFLCAALPALYPLKKKWSLPIVSSIKICSILFKKFQITFIVWLFFTTFALFYSRSSSHNYSLPIEFFILISGSGFIILLQIFSIKHESKLKKYSSIILIEILILSITFSYSFLYLFPTSYGNDASYHIGFIEHILDSSSLQGYSGYYLNHPIFHILSVCIIQIVGIDNVQNVQSILCLIQIFFLVVVFSTVKNLFDLKTSLISVLLLSFAPHLVQARYMYYPNVFSTIYFIMILYLISKQNMSLAIKKILLLITFIVIVFTHPLTTIITISLLLFIYFEYLYLNINVRDYSYYFIILTLVTTLSYWMKDYTREQNIFTVLVTSLKTAFEESDYYAVERVTLSPFYSYSDIILSDLGYIFLIIVGVIGAFYSLQHFSYNGGYKKASLFSIVTLFFIPIPFLLTLVYPQSLPDRWFPFIEILSSLFIGFASIIILEELLDGKKVFIVLSILAISMFFMLSTPIVNPNSQLYSSELSGKAALFESEQASIKFLDSVDLENIHGSSTLMAVAFNKQYINREENYINPSNNNTYDTGFVILTNSDLKNGFKIPLYGKRLLLEKIAPTKQFILFLDESNKIYSNNEVQIYANKWKANREMY